MGDTNTGGQTPPAIAPLLDSSPTNKTIIDPAHVDWMSPADANVASGQGDFNHLDHVGDEVDDEESAAVLAALADGGA